MSLIPSFRGPWSFSLSCILLLLLSLASNSVVVAFTSHSSKIASHPTSRYHSSLYLSTKPSRSNDKRKGSSNSSSSSPSKRKKEFTLKDLREELERRPDVYLEDPKKKKGNYRRSRSRSENPQQQYVYARQRKAQQQGVIAATATATTLTDGDTEGETVAASDGRTTTQPPLLSIPVALARENGLTNPASQHCDPLVDTIVPQILGQLRVSNDKTKDATTSGSFAYVIHKPAGWAILGGQQATTSSTNSKSSQPKQQQQQQNSESKKENKKQSTTRVEITDVDGSKSALEFNDDALLAVMTSEERAEYEAELNGEIIGDEDANDEAEILTSKPTKVSKKPRTKKVKVKMAESDSDTKSATTNDNYQGDDDYVDMENIDLEERELLFQLSPEELAEFEQEMGPLDADLKQELDELHRQQQMVSEESVETAAEEEEGEAGEEAFEEEPEIASKIDIDESSSNNNKAKPIDAKTKEVYSKIEARKSAAKASSASFSPASRPSLVAWLKDLKGREGNPMKGGKYWTALAGATSVDDSGIVILCPKEFVDNIFVDYLEYVAVVGNDNYLAPKQKGTASTSLTKDEMSMEVLSTVRRGRGTDTVQTVKVLVQDDVSSCSSIVQSCQQQFQDGIRGDPAGNPLGRLANRRLVHCAAVSASSLVHDESIEVETDGVPDDIAILAERRNQHQYKEGSFLGRSALRNNPLTNAYREMNGAGDGYPGWTVDRYDKWLFVQHDDMMPKGPLPSIHDGNTAGVYYLPANPNRSAMGSTPSGDKTLTRPQLMEGQPAPDIISILENGITYQVSLDKDLSTGIFLDQRPQRAWLARNCNADTHVLNCFAHCGGYSIAAATAGASTTSIDLNKHWLDRVEPQLQANGIEYDIRHDCIYGDCFDWLAKLAKRGEKYDIVILDPPSSSVGKKKKRWSIKNDMPELVALAAQVVKKGGLLWTTTNSASVTPVKFAKLCRQGLDDAGLKSAKLERIQPMPHDFPSIGPQPVKNYVWRLP